MGKLTADQVEKIALDFFLGKEPSIKGDDADKLREDLKKDQKFAKKMGWTIELPFDYND